MLKLAKEGYTGDCISCFSSASRMRLAKLQQIGVDSALLWAKEWPQDPSRGQTPKVEFTACIQLLLCKRGSWSRALLGLELKIV